MASEPAEPFESEAPSNLGGLVPSARIAGNEADFCRDIPQQFKLRVNCVQ